MTFYSEFVGVYSGINNNPALKTSDGGRTWHSLNISAKISFQDSTLMWAYNNNGLFKSTDNGLIWENVLSSRITGIKTKENKIFATNYFSSAMYFSDDNGLTWDTLSQNIINSNVKSVCFWDSLTGLTVGTNSSIYKTTDGGVTWKFKPSIIGVEFNKVICVGNTDSWVLGGNGLILFSSDRGESWIDKTFNTDVTHRAISVFNNVVFVTSTLSDGGSSGIYYKSTDYGNSWESKIFPHSDGIYFEYTTSAFFLNSTLGWALTAYPSSLYKTNNGGNNWTRIGYVSAPITPKMLFITPQIGWLYKGENILKTIDGGANWVDRSVPLWGSANGPTVHFFVDENIFYVITNNVGRTFYYKSNDAGLTIQKEYINYQRIYDLFFINENIGWAVGNNVILSTIESQPVSVFQQNEYVFIRYQLSQNYPNPFNPTTKIKYSIPKIINNKSPVPSVAGSIINLKVYDVLGNEIATLVNEEKPPGEYEVEFDGSGLASGVYFYRLTAGANIVSKKMIILK